MTRRQLPYPKGPGLPARAVGEAVGAAVLPEAVLEVLEEALLEAEAPVEAGRKIQDNLEGLL
jgi:hypothetical protein